MKLDARTHEQLLALPRFKLDARTHEQLVALCNSIPQPLVRSALYLALAVLRRRDQAKYEEICAELGRLEARAQEPGFDLHYEPIRLMWMGGASSALSRRRFENTTAGLLHDFAWVSLWLKETPREDWPGLADTPWPRLILSRTLSAHERESLQKTLSSARSARQAALAILHMAGWGDPANISSRLSRFTRPAGP